MNTPRAGLGGASAALQTAASAVLLFWTYRTVNASAGAEAFGVWATVVGIATLLNMAELGLATSVLRQAAVSIAEQNPQNAARIVETGMFTVFVALSATCMVAWWPLQQVLHRIFSASYHPLIDQLLPLALCLVVSNALGILLVYAFDVLGSAHERAVLMLCTQALMAGVAFSLVDRWGVMALMVGQLSQSVLFVVAGWSRLGRLLPDLARGPWRWNKRAAASLLSYGVRWQGLAAMQTAVDPAVRGLLGHFGGPVLAGQYEFVSKVVLQARNVGVSALQTLVPRVTHAEVHDPQQLETVLHVMKRWAAVLVAVLLPGFWLGGPFLGSLWTSPPEKAVVSMLAVLGAAWSVNLLSAPAYLFLLGQAQLKRIGYSHAAALITAVGGGAVGGALWGGLGVVAAYGLSVVVSALVVDPRCLWSRGGMPSVDFRLGSAVAVGCAVGLVFVLRPIASPVASLVVASLYTAVLFALLVQPPGWRARLGLSHEPLP